MKCEFCGGELEYETTTCRHCGASCQYIKQPVEEKEQNEVESHTSEIKKDDPDDLRPIGNTDISFLKKNQKENQEQEENQVSSSGCAIGCAIIIVIIVIIIICCH